MKILTNEDATVFCHFVKPEGFVCVGTVRRSLQEVKES